MTKIHLTIQVLLAIILGAFGGYVLGGVISKSAEADLKYDQEVYDLENYEFDYRVADPLKDKVLEIDSLSHVEKVLPLYRELVTMKKGTSSFDFVITFSDYKNADIAGINEKFILKGSSSIGNDEIVVDEVLANKLNLLVNDEVTVYYRNAEALTFTVKGITRPNRFNENGSAYFNLTEAQEAVFIAENSRLRYIELYIKSSNSSQTYNYLKDYIPEGRMSLPEDFEFETQYNSYRDQFLARSYENEIFDRVGLKSDRINLFGFELEIAETNYLYSIIISFVLVIFIFTAELVASSLYNKRKVKQINVSVDWLRRNLHMFLSVLLIIISSFSLMYLQTNSLKQTTYLDKIVFHNRLVIGAAAFVLYLIYSLVGSAIVKKKAKKKANKTNPNLTKKLIDINTNNALILNEHYNVKLIDSKIQVLNKKTNKLKVVKRGSPLKLKVDKKTFIIDSDLIKAWELHFQDYSIFDLYYVISY